MKFFAPGLAVAIALVASGCGGGGMGPGPTPITGGGSGAIMSTSRTTFGLSSGAATTHDLPSSDGFGGSVTLPAANAPAGTTMSIEATTNQPSGVATPQLTQRQPLDVGGVSILFFLTFTVSTDVTLNGFPNFSIVVPAAKHAAGQFFLALSVPAGAGIQAQFQTLGPAADDGTTLHFTGFTDSLKLKAGTPYTFALYAVEQETRPAGAFYPLYTGDKRPSLDVIQGTGEFTAAANTLTFSALMAGPIQSGQDNFYVWGVNRGGTTVAPFPQEPNVQFNAVVSVETPPSGGVNASVTLIPGATTSLPASAVKINGAKITVTVPTSALPSLGLDPSAYRWNLWPRDAVGGPPSQVAKFIPDNALAPFLPGAQVQPSPNP